jgi:hypothetical protein
VLGTPACERLIASISIEASTSTYVLLAYPEQVLVPKFSQGKPVAVLVIDNLCPHQATQVREMLAPQHYRRAGCLRLVQARWLCPTLIPKTLSFSGSRVFQGVPKLPLNLLAGDDTSRPYFDFFGGRNLSWRISASSAAVWSAWPSQPKQ